MSSVFTRKVGFGFGFGFGTRLDLFERGVDVSCGWDEIKGGESPLAFYSDKNSIFIIAILGRY